MNYQEPGRLISESGKVRLVENGQIYENEGTVLVNALPERYDSSTDKWVTVHETVSDGSGSYGRYTVDPDVLSIAAGAFEGSKFDNVVLPENVVELDKKAFMSTTTNPDIAASFSSHSNTMIVIYASSEALTRLGAVVIDSFSGWGAGEYEILLNFGAKFKVLDVGTLEVSDGQNMSTERTYIRLELVPSGDDPDDEQNTEPQDEQKEESKADPDSDKQDSKTDADPDSDKQDSKADAEPAVVKQPVPVIHTSAKAGRKIQVYWNKVKGASYYRLQYRKAGASKWKTLKVSKTSRILRKMKEGGLYQFRVAAVGSNKKTGQYSKTSHRFYRKTKGIKYRAKKGAVKVSWKKTRSASGYRILVSTNRELKNARVITIKGGKRTSAVVKGLRSGKKYYFSVRPYKNKGGSIYIGIRSKIKKVKVK